MSAATKSLDDIANQLYDLGALLEAVRSHVEAQHERELIQADASNELTRLCSMAANQAGRLANELVSEAEKLAAGVAA
jgi:alkylation response protein AidB-like acyl-CoA dehydrogenase